MDLDIRSRNWTRRSMLQLMLLAAGSSAASASSYPNRLVRLVVPFPPGGGTDVVARQFAQHFEQRISGAKFVIENKAGAAGTLGADAVSKSAPDGYTIGMMDTGFVTNPSLFSKLPYDPVAGFTILGVVATSPVVLVGNSSLGVRTYTDLIGLIRQRSGEITFASAGVGSINHLAGEMMKQQEAVKMRHVPYRGGGPALSDVIGGHVNLMFASPSAVKQMVDDGQLIAFAVTGQNRAPILPNVPTALEVSGKVLDADAIYTLVAPSGLHAGIAKRLNDAIVAAASDREYVQRMTDMGFRVEAIVGPDASELLHSQRAKWADLIKTAGIKLD